MPALGDNFMYLIEPTSNSSAILVDPVDHRLASHEVIKQKTRLESILCTHHHADHDAGNLPLKRIYPEGNFEKKNEKIVFVARAFHKVEFNPPIQLGKYRANSIMFLVVKGGEETDFKCNFAEISVLNFMWY